MSTRRCIIFKWLVTDGHSPCPVRPGCRHHWAGAQDTWPYMSSSSCWCLCHLVLGLSLNLGTWKSTCEWTLRGWVSLQCIVNATSCCLAGNHVVRISHVSGWHNSFAACFCPYCDILGKFLVVFLVGLWPFVGVLVVFLAMICEASCDHRRPCISFLINSFVSWGLSLRAWSAEPEEKIDVVKRDPLRLIAYRRVRFCTFMFVSTLVLGKEGNSLNPI